MRWDFAAEQEAKLEYGKPPLSIERFIMAGLPIGVPIETIVEATYESGTAVIIRNVRYDWRQDLAGQRVGVYKFFNKQQGSTHANSFVRTNMQAPGMIENGRAFEVQQIAVKAVKRHPATVASGAVTALTSYSPVSGWYDLVLQTLFNYGTLVFRVNGTDHCGQYPLSLFLTAVANQGDGNFTSGSSIAQAVIDLKDKTIPLSSLVNFSVELHLDIPQSIWGQGANGFDWLPLAQTDIRGFVPDGTDIMIGLIGKEVYSQR